MKSTQQATNFFEKYYPQLNLLRAIAIAMVLIWHFNDFFKPLFLGTDYLNHFISAGWRGVDLFFVLSGFLIGGQLIEANMRGQFSFRKFYWNRFWRIVPPYYTSIVVFTTFICLFKQEWLLSIRDTAKSITSLFIYAQNYNYYIGIEYIKKSGFYWTLAVEEQFYILIPLIIYMAFKYVPRNLFTILIVLVLSGFFVKFALYDVNANWWHNYYTPFHTRFDSLCYGVLSAYFYIYFHDVIKKFAYSIEGRILTIIVVITSLFLSLNYGTFEEGYFNTCWQFTLSALGFSILMLYMMIRPFPVLGRFQGFIDHLSNVSYTIYLYHIIILIGLEMLFTASELSLLSYSSLLVGYLVSVVTCSTIIYRLIDIPCIKHRGSRLKMVHRALPGNRSPDLQKEIA